MNEIVLHFNIPSLILICITLLAIGVCFFLIGYFYGSHHRTGVSNITNHKEQYLPNNKTTSISIDETKFVTDIKTDNLEKKYQSLGDIKQSTESISQSINKLKNMKG